MKTFKGFAALNEGSSDLVSKTYTIDASPSMIDAFERFLSHVQWCSGVGHSTYVAMYVDGDGADRFKVKDPDVKDRHSEKEVTTMKGGVERL